MHHPTVSIIIPTYNRLTLLKEAINSVLTQTYSDFELIISDNCSTDGTQAWATQLSKARKNVFYFRNKTNLGMVGNWNAGIKHACGKYISLLMDDDYWDPNFLDKTVTVLNTQTTVGLTAVNIWTVNLRQEKWKVDMINDFYRLYHSNTFVSGIDCIKKYFLDYWLVGLPSAILFRRKCFINLGSFDINGFDPEFWLRICTKFDFYYLDEKLCYWRKTPGGFTLKSVYSYSNIKYRMYLFNKIVPRLDNNLYKPFIEKVKRKHRLNLIHHYINKSKDIYNKEWWKMYKNVASVYYFPFDILRAYLEKYILFKIN